MLEEEYEQHKKQVLASLKEGQIIDGTVQRLTPFGAFVDVGGIDGLVHVSELAWKHVAHPRDVVSEGQEVRVKVLKVDPEAGKISLSIKAAQPGPWDLAADKFTSAILLPARCAGSSASVRSWKLRPVWKVCRPHFANRASSYRDAA